MTCRSWPAALYTPPQTVVERGKKRGIRERKRTKTGAHRETYPPPQIPPKTRPHPPNPRTTPNHQTPESLNHKTTKLPKPAPTSLNPVPPPPQLNTAHRVCPTPTLGVWAVQLRRRTVPLESRPELVVLQRSLEPARDFTVLKLT